MSIIIVDDSKVNRLLLRRILEERGMKDLCEAGDVHELFALIGFEGAGTQPPACRIIDLILMDVMMPEIDGIEATRRLKSSAEFHDVPIIMVTAAGEGELLERAFAAGAMDYLTKPIDALELAARVKSALALKSEMDMRKARELELLALQKQLVQSNQNLHNAMTQIQKDLEVAAQVQQRMLPAQGASYYGIQSNWRLLPCSRLGGDFLNLLPFSDRKTGFLLVDVAGHGVQAALLAFTLSHLLSRAGAGGSLLTGRDGNPFSPGQVLTRLNQRFCDDEQFGQYFTIVYGIFDVTEKTVSLSRAGHPPALHLFANGEVAWRTEGGPPIGMVEEIEFPEDHFSVSRGDRLFVYSDGITETAHQDTGKLLGETGMAEALKRSLSSPLSESLDDVVKVCSSWRGTREQADDMSILGLEFL